MGLVVGKRGGRPRRRVLNDPPSATPASGGPHGGRPSPGRRDRPGNPGSGNSVPPRPPPGRGRPASPPNLFHLLPGPGGGGRGRRAFPKPPPRVGRGGRALFLFRARRRFPPTSGDRRHGARGALRRVVVGAGGGPADFPGAGAAHRGTREGRGRPAFRRIAEARVEHSVRRGGRGHIFGREIELLHQRSPLPVGVGTIGGRRRAAGYSVQSQAPRRDRPHPRNGETDAAGHPGPGGGSSVSGPK